MIQKERYVIHQYTLSLPFLVRLAEEVETDFFLLGATAVEDRL
jgi:hypothetical protein